MRDKKEEIENLVEEYPKHFYWKVRKQYPKVFQYANQKFASFDSFSERLYLYLYGESVSTCNYFNCDEICSFRSFSEGFLNYCSQTCGNKNREKRTCIICDEDFIVKKSRNKKMCSRGCWREWNKKESVQEKFKESRRETLKERYGDENYRNVEKAKKTKKERYGDPNYCNYSKAIKTKRKKYGENLEEIVKKVKKTKKERYGDPNYCNLEKIKEKNKRKYGVKWFFQSDEFKEKARKTKIEKYGDEKYNNKKKIKRTNLRRGYKRIISENGKLSNIKVEPLFDLEDYEGLHDNKKHFEYPFLCSDCGLKFEDTIGTGNLPKCPNCNPTYRSEGEKEVSNFISSILSEEVEVKENVRDLIDNGEIDIYIPEKNVAIEFNGLYWHSELSSGRGRSYHLDKTQQCENKGIHLIHIFENEWNDKNKIVKNRLKYILNTNENSVYARNCEIKEISPKRKNEFLENYHLQGKGNSSVKLGLFFQNDLVSVMTFSKRRIALGGDPNNNSEEYEMTRFCSSSLVIGAAGKLFSYFIKNFEPSKVVSYADRRWTKNDNETVYDKLGFSLIKETSPSYWYYCSDDFSLYHRFNFRKSILKDKLEDFDPDLTEWENMKKHGYDRIWDCGTLKYIWKDK